MSKLIYPTLDLFLYQSREGLSENVDEIKTNHAKFWANLPENLKVSLNAEETADDVEYLRLLELSEAASKQKQFFFTATVGGYPLEASYYPIRLSDTYALLFDCSVDDKITPHSLSCLQHLKSLADYKNGNLGKTWMISGYLSPSADAEPLAKSAYEEFTSREWQNFTQGKFLGSTVFEVWNPPRKWQNVEAENHHVLIFLYPNLQTIQKTTSFYKLWLQLFCYRNKIIWAYGESHKIKKELQTLLANIKAKRFNIEHQFNKEQLQEIQKFLLIYPGLPSEYISKLSYLEILQQTINSNLASYQKYLNEIVEKANDLAKQDIRMEANDLKFMEDFIQVVEQKYLSQLAQNYTNLSHGTKVLENLMGTMRGILEIERLERDRILTNTLTNTVAIASIGVATSSITATIVSKQLPEPKEPISTTTAFFWSIASGLVPVAIALILLRYLRRDRT